MFCDATFVNLTVRTATLHLSYCSQTVTLPIKLKNSVSVYLSYCTYADTLFLTLCGWSAAGRNIFAKRATKDWNEG